MCFVLLSFVSLTLAQLGPVYVLRAEININNIGDRQRINVTNSFSHEEYYEWEGFDGWFNNPAHPEWGGAGKKVVKL